MGDLSAREDQEARHWVQAWRKAYEYGKMSDAPQMFEEWSDELFRRIFSVAAEGHVLDARLLRMVKEELGDNAAGPLIGHALGLLDSERNFWRGVQSLPVEGCPFCGGWITGDGVDESGLRHYTIRRGGVVADRNGGIIDRPRCCSGDCNEEIYFPE